MKNNPILLLLLIILAIGLFYYNNSKPVVGTTKKPTSIKNAQKKASDFEVVKNEFIQSQKELNGIICKPIEEVIQSSMNGKIEFIKNGSFKSGDLLFRFENQTLFKNLADNKKELKTRLEKVIPELENENASKWKAYITTLEPEKVLSAFPDEITEKEKDILKRYNCISLYNLLVDQENEMEAYFILASSSGNLKNIQFKLGDNITTKDTLAIKTEITPILVKASIPRESIKDIKSFEKTIYSNINNYQNIGNGKFFYLKKNYKKDSSLVYYSFLPNQDFEFRYGDKVSLTLSKNKVESCYKLPLALLRVDSTITLLNNSRKKVRVVKSTSKYHYVNGLLNGDTVRINK